MSHSAEGSEHAESHGRRSYLRARMLHDHLEQVARQHPGTDSQNLLEGLTYASAILLLDQTSTPAPTPPADTEDAATARNDNETGVRLPGGLSEADVKRLGSPSTLTNRQVEKQLLHELKRTLLTVLEFWTNAEDASEEERLQSALELPEEIRAQKVKIVQQRADLKAHYVRTQQLVNNINEIHPRLEDVLTTALTTLPPILNATRAAQADVLAMTIETCLLKLSLIRARTHATLYGHTSSTNPDASMSRALAAAHARLAAKRRLQDEEERALDSEIGEYERMLSLVDGRDGGFAQVVKDMARVKSETEECKRDLRRLGWTGD